jgi:CheY-like chemotaxis protein
MNKSILILEENSMIHGLIASALDLDGLTLHHEFDPEEYVGRARSLMPDLILLSNADQKRDYAVCRELRGDSAFRNVPLVLLCGSKDSVPAERLRNLRVDGVIRKPFEASDLQQQVSKHLNIVDLIGSAYDYKKSQSLRDEGMGPLADLEVLDQEILGFLRDSADQARGGPVPKVDFSRELAAEPASAAAPMMEQAALEEALEPERAFEPVPRVDGEAPAGPETLWAEDVPLAGADFDEAAAAEREAAPLAAGEEPLEELGAQDVLDEGDEEETRWAPEGFDQSFEEPQREPEPPMERVEMELAGADIDFDAAAEEFDEGEVELFEADFGKREHGGEGVDEMIPEAVRRMVEMKPVLTMAQGAPPRGEELRSEIGFAPEDDELAAMAEELEQLDEIPVGETVTEARAQAPAPSRPAQGEPGRSEWELAAPGQPSVESDDEEFFHADYLGDDEIDEEKIRQALEEPESGEPEFEVVLDEDTDFEADVVEDFELKEIEALDSVDLDLSDEGGEEEEIVIDPDEESMVFSSIEQDQALEEAEPPAEPLEEARLEAFSEEAPSEGAMPEDLLDQQLEALEETAKSLDEPEEPPRRAFAEPASGLDETPLGVEEEGAPKETWEFSATAEGREQQEPFISDDARAMAAFAHSGERPAAEALADSGAEPGGATAFAERAEQAGLEEPGEVAALEEMGAEFPGFEEDRGAPPGADFAEILPPEEIPHEKARSDFDAVLAELQAEIEANPVGERLDDVLAKEAVVQAVEAVEFAIPQHEHPFTRALGVLEIPGGVSVSEKLLQSITATSLSSAPAGFTPRPEPPPAAVPSPGPAARTMVEGLKQGAEGLHEGIVSRLSAVLDEMIRDAVRRVVREEVPQLMEQLRREESGHGR